MITNENLYETLKHREDYKIKVPRTRIQSIVLGRYMSELDTIQDELNCVLRACIVDGEILKIDGDYKSNRLNVAVKSVLMNGEKFYTVVKSMYWG